MPLLRLRILHARTRLLLAALPIFVGALRRQLSTPAGRLWFRRGLTRFAIELTAVFGLGHLIGSLPDGVRHGLGSIAVGALLSIHAPRIFSRFIWKTKP